MDVYYVIENHFISFLVVVGLTLWVIVWIFNFVRRGVCKSKVRMDGKTVIITGSDSGIGKATALDLAKRGARVIMACVNMENALIVKDEIILRTGNNNIVVKYLDLSNFDSVRKFAEKIIKNEEKLDVLIHNAGILIPPKPVTENGLNMTLATNYFGPFLLTHLLIALLKKTNDSRIIFVVSSAYKLAKARVDPGYPNPTMKQPTNKFHFMVYAMSKFACVLFMKELCRRLQGSGVTANCLHPGMVATSIIIKGHILPDFMYILISSLVPFAKNPNQGAQTSIYLAVAEEVRGVSGKYFADCKVRSAGKAADDEDLAKKYWRVSEEIVGLKDSDPHI